MRSTLQDQLDAIEKHLNKNFIEMTGETMDDRLTEEEIEAVIQTVFEYASQFREPSTQGGEECGYYTKNGSTYYGPLKAEIERLKQENGRMREALGSIMVLTRDYSIYNKCKQALNPKD